MFTAGSNKAIDVAADRLLDQLSANDEPTDRIYWIKIDALEWITADPEMRERDDANEWTEGEEQPRIRPKRSPRSPSLTTYNPIERTHGIEAVAKRSDMRGRSCCARLEEGKPGMTLRLTYPR